MPSARTLVAILEYVPFTSFRMYEIHENKLSSIS